MKKRTLVFGNGRLHKKYLKEIQPGDYIIGVDRAAYWLIESGVTPQLAIGDFDSITKKEFLTIKKSVTTVKKFSPNKNWTDMELALKNIRGETLIFGWSGSRFDHTLAALYLAKNHMLIDKTNRVREIFRGRTILKPSAYRYVSVIPVTAKIVLRLKDFKYSLPKTTIRRGSTRTISNEFIGKPGIIELFAGTAWVIESND